MTNVILETYKLLGKGNDVRYSNYFYEKREGFVDDTIITKLTPKSPFGKPTKFLQNVKYNPKIQNSKRIKVMSLWTESKIKKVIFDIEYIDQNQFDETAAFWIDSSLLSQKIDEEIKKGLHHLNESECFWVTPYDPNFIFEKNNWIMELGLDHLTKYDKQIYALVFEINKSLYKPNITNNPSEIAYCAIPNSSKWGNTIHLKLSTPGKEEAVLPYLELNRNNLKFIEALHCKPSKKKLNFKKKDVICLTKEIKKRLI